MGKKMGMLFMVLLCVFLLWPMPVLASEDAIKNDETGVPDAGLYQWILAALDKNENETFTRQEAATIEWLDTRGYRPIRRLKGIECLSNVVQVDLRDHGVIDLEGIEKLTNLKHLSLEGSRVKSIEPISHMYNLESLDLDSSGITSLKGIGNLKNLSSLWLSHNGLKNINEIKNLVNLECLYLDENKLTNLNAVKKLKKLKKLDVRDNALKKAEGLKNLKNLEHLELSDNKLTDVSEIKNLTKLQYLSLSGNNLKSLPSLKKLKKLYTVSVNGNYLPEKELASKLPHRFWKNKSWQADTVNLQKLNADVTLMFPASVNQITKNTTRIEGIVSRLPSYKKETYVQLYNPANRLYRTKRWKVGADGKFVISGISLKKWGGETVYLRVMVYSQESKEWKAANSIRFVVKE